MSFNDARASAGQQCQGLRRTTQKSNNPCRSIALVVLALLSLVSFVAPWLILDTACCFAGSSSNIVFMCLGAAAYALYQAQRATVRRASLPPSGGRATSVLGTRSAEQAIQSAETRRRRGVAQRAFVGAAEAAFKIHHGAAILSEQPQPASVQPIVPWSLSTEAGWEASAQELLDKISPAPASDQIAEDLARAVGRIIKEFLPEAEVVAFASGKAARGTALGVAVPEIDVVACVPPEALRLRVGVAAAAAKHGSDPNRRLQKAALRACTDRLVGRGGFKFRRSTFRCQDPTVTLLAPLSFGTFEEARPLSLPFTFTVNSSVALLNAVLLTECGQIDRRARDLICLVRRWAKDRGICQATRGHLTPYCWTLLTIYFLQVGVGDGEPVLPALEGFARSSRLQVGQRPAVAGGPSAGSKAREAKEARSASAGGMAVSELLKEFFRFYANEFDFRNEAVSVLLGRRAAPGPRLSLHIILSGEDAKVEVGPSIEDPFDPQRNMGDHMTSEGLIRLREELARANGICAGDGHLVELLEPWLPPFAVARATAAKETHG